MKPQAPGRTPHRASWRAFGTTHACAGLFAAAPGAEAPASPLRHSHAFADATLHAFGTPHCAPSARPGEAPAREAMSD